MMPELEIDALLQPLPGDQPCGVSLIHDPEYDAIRTARRADDASVPAGIWQTTLKVADWAAVEAGCRRVRHAHGTLLPARRAGPPRSRAPDRTSRSALPRSRAPSRSIR